MKIEILLSTYNGVRYLPFLLDSLLSQTNKDWHLTIRDDGSTDNTLDIINQYATRNPQRIGLLTDNKGNLGTTLSFEQLLLSAPEADYYMFCDQDDVWLNDKIDKSLNIILLEEQRHNHAPITIFTDLAVCDERLTRKNSFFKINRVALAHCKKFEYICVANPAAGCTMMFNSKTRVQATPFPFGIMYHDHWIASYTAKYGFLTILDEETILYRQHSSNVVGTQETPIKHYLHRILHPMELLREGEKTRPMLQALHYGGTIKWWWNKLIYFILRRL